MLRMFLSLVAIATLAMLRPHVQSAPQSVRSSQPPRPVVVTNINTASLAELQTLPGVGAKTAARIIDYRQQKGPFKTIEELMNVRGIDEKSFLRLKPQITVAGGSFDRGYSVPEGETRPYQRTWGDASRWLVG